MPVKRDFSLSGRGTIKISRHEAHTHWVTRHRANVAGFLERVSVRSRTNDDTPPIILSDGHFDTNIQTSSLWCNMEV